MIFLFSGIPAAGKSEFCRFLARDYSFAHYDLECFPRGWPHPELKELWDRDPADFVRQLSSTHARVALDWGFPPGCRAIVEELLRGGVRLIWFSADIGQARLRFIERGGIDVANFDRQVDEIARTDLPHALEAIEIETLNSNGDFLGRDEIFHQLRKVLCSA